MPSLALSHSVNKRKKEKETITVPEAFGELSASRGWCQAQLCAQRCSPGADLHPDIMSVATRIGPRQGHNPLRVQCGRLGTAPVQSTSSDILEGGKVFWLPMARSRAWVRPSSPRPSQECKYFSLSYEKKPPKSKPQNNPGRGKSPRRSLLTPSSPSPPPHPLTQGHR